MPSELAPGTYRADNTSSRCRIHYDNIYLVASGPGRVTLEVRAEWSSVSTSNCGTFEAHTPIQLTAFGDGVYVVPSELAPGTYRANDTSSRCRIHYDNIYLVASGPGRVTFEVQPEWSSVSTSNCGTFEAHTPNRLTAFGDGVYVVPSELAPGTYRADNTSSRCRIHYDNIYLVASGPGRVTFEVASASATAGPSSALRRAVVRIRQASGRG